MVFYTKGVLKTFSKFIGKQLCWSLKLQTWDLQFYLKKKIRLWCFSVNFAKFLRSVFYGISTLAAFETFYLHLVIFLSENKIKETPKNNQIYSFFEMNSCWTFQIANASIYEFSNHDWYNAQHFLLFFHLLRKSVF